MKIKTRERLFRLGEKGFTLIELMIGSLIAIALLALIAGIIKSQGNSFKNSSRPRNPKCPKSPIGLIGKPQ